VLIDVQSQARITSCVVSPSAPACTLCLGQAQVDLACERPIAQLSEAEAFVPRFGGPMANVAVIAARAGARVALVGRAGDDSWGRWVRARLERESVETSYLTLVAGAKTPLALVQFDGAGEPAFTSYGEVRATVAPRRAEAATAGARACERWVRFRRRPRVVRACE
jgi:sugar/nucleoside kinase (ribokinase family)